MKHTRFRGARRLLLCSLAGICTLGIVGARAAPYEFIYTGAFNSSEALTVATASSPGFFANSTPFTIHAFYNDSSPNLLPFSPLYLGTRAYAPSSAAIDIAGSHYNIETISTNAISGVAVTVFDRNNFSNPGLYGVGLISNPVNNGAGFLGVFASASPAFVVDALTPTVFGDYQGVSHSSGVCISGIPPNCPRLDTPWVLHDSSSIVYNLTLGTYSEDYPFLHPGSDSTTVGPLNTAVFLGADMLPPLPPTSVPEPSSSGLLLAALLGMAVTILCADLSSARRRRNWSVR